MPGGQGHGDVAFLVGKLADAQVALRPGGHADQGDQGDQPVAEQPAAQVLADEVDHRQLAHQERERHSESSKPGSHTWLSTVIRYSCQMSTHTRNVVTAALSLITRDLQDLPCSQSWSRSKIIPGGMSSLPRHRQLAVSSHKELASRLQESRGSRVPDRCGDGTA
jgi:hypothetical protein